MTPASPGMVVIAYVRDIAVSRRFYQLIGFVDQPGEPGTGSALASLRYGDCGLLLAANPPPGGVSSPSLLLCLPVDDVQAVGAALRASGFEVPVAGRPQGPGGQASLIDPDGNTVMLSQRARPDEFAAVGSPRAWPDRSLFDDAADILAARGEVPVSCQVRDIDHTRCAERAAVKLADSAGESVWACLDHVDEILVTVRGAFIASAEDRGLAGFLARRRLGQQPS
jgi:hypothetical protein